MGNEITIPGVGTRLRILRKSKGLSLREVARRAEMDPASLSNYERGKTTLTIEQLERIAKANGCSPEAVMLTCLKDRYPKLRDTKLAKELDAIVARIEESHRKSNK